MSPDQPTWNQSTPPSGRPFAPPSEDDGETIVRRLSVEAGEETYSGPIERLAGSGDETLVLSLQSEPNVVFGYLVVADGERASAVFPLSKITNLGRSGDDNDIILDDRRVSRRHARIRQEGNEFILHDLASTNGTWAGNEPDIRRLDAPYTLAEGGLIRFGDTRLLFMKVLTGSE